MLRVFDYSGERTMAMSERRASMFGLKIQTRQRYLDELDAAYSMGAKVGYRLGQQAGYLDCQNQYYAATYRSPDNLAAHADMLLRELGLEG